MNKVVCKLVCSLVVLSATAFMQSCASKKMLEMPVKQNQVVVISNDTPYTEVIPTKEGSKEMDVLLKMSFDEPNNTLTIALTSKYNLFGFKNNSLYKNVIRNKKISLARLPYKVVSEGEMTYRLSKNVRNNIPGCNDKHTFNAWVSSTGLHPKNAEYIMVVDTLSQTFDIVADTTITINLADIMMMTRSVSKKNRYDINYYTNLDKQYEVVIDRNPCLAMDAELESTKAMLEDIQANYTTLADKYPSIEELNAETLQALEEARVKLVTRYNKVETTHECPTIQTMLESYNSYVDSIAKLSEVKKEFAHKRPKLSVPADQLLAVARMVDNNVASYLVSNDVVEKADLVKRNKKLIEDINKKLSKKMTMDKEQTNALSVFKKAERYFNETCLSNKRR
jgi:uncharacterized protein YutE (UPF0331/DUF86 family)